MKQCNQWQLAERSNIIWRLRRRGFAQTVIRVAKMLYDASYGVKGSKLLKNSSYDNRTFPCVFLHIFVFFLKYLTKFWSRISESYRCRVEAAAACYFLSATANFIKKFITTAVDSKYHLPISSILLFFLLLFEFFLVLVAFSPAAVQPESTGRVKYFPRSVLIIKISFKTVVSYLIILWPRPKNTSLLSTG